jgi:hypothetical protein
MGKTQSKALAARHGRGIRMGVAWERHGMCELAFNNEILMIDENP